MPTSRATYHIVGLLNHSGHTYARRSWPTFPTCPQTCFAHPTFLFWGHHGSTVSSQTSVGHPNHFLLLWHHVASHALLDILPCSVDGTRHSVLHDSMEALQGLSTCCGPELNGFRLERNCTSSCSSPCGPARNHPGATGEVPTCTTDTYARCVALARLKLRHMEAAWTAFPPGRKPLSHTDPIRNSVGMTFPLMFFRSWLVGLASLHDALSHHDPLQSQAAVSCHQLGVLSTFHFDPCLLVKLIYGTTNHHMLLPFAPLPELVRCPRYSRPKVTLKTGPDLIIMRRLMTRSLLIDELQKVFFGNRKIDCLWWFVLCSTFCVCCPVLNHSCHYHSAGPPSLLILRFCSIILLFIMQGDAKTDVKESALSDRAALHCLRADAVEQNSIHTFFFLPYCNFLRVRLQRNVMGRDRFLPDVNQKEIMKVMFTCLTSSAGAVREFEPITHISCKTCTPAIPFHSDSDCSGLEECFRTFHQVFIHLNDVLAVYCPPAEKRGSFFPSGNLFSHPWRRTHKRELIPQYSGPNRMLRMTSVPAIKQNSELSRAHIPLANLTQFEASTEQFFPTKQMKDACPTSEKQIDIRRC